MEFQFLGTSDSLSAEERVIYAQLTEAGAAQDGIFTMTDEGMTVSLKNLSRLLVKHYGRNQLL